MAKFKVRYTLLGVRVMDTRYWVTPKNPNPTIAECVAHTQRALERGDLELSFIGEEEDDVVICELVED